MLLRALLQTLDNQLLAAAGDHFLIDRLRYYVASFFLSLFGMAVVMKKLVGAELPIYVTSPDLVGIILAGFGLMNLVLALAVSLNRPRKALVFLTVATYGIMLAVLGGENQANWPTILAINVVYVLLASFLLLRTVPDSRLRSFFLIQLFSTLLLVQGPFMFLTLVPEQLIRGSRLELAGLCLFGAPFLILVFSFVWTVTGPGIRVGFLIVLGVALQGYSFILIGQNLSVGYMTASGVAIEVIFVPLVVYLLVMSGRRLPGSPRRT